MKPAETVVACERLLSISIAQCTSRDLGHAYTHVTSRQVSSRTLPVARRWSHKHIFATTVTSRNNGRTVGKGVFCWFRSEAIPRGPEGNGRVSRVGFEFGVRQPETERVAWWRWSSSHCCKTLRSNA
jgi:hypothetical protein